jgi:hypothetical protein
LLLVTASPIAHDAVEVSISNYFNPLRESHAIMLFEFRAWRLCRPTLMTGRGSELRRGWLASATQLGLTFRHWGNSEAVRISGATSGNDMKPNTDDSEQPRVTRIGIVRRLCAKKKKSQPRTHA